MTEADENADEPFLDSKEKSQAQAGTEAGMSERQIKTAVRVSNVPKDEFEKQIESD